MELKDQVCTQEQSHKLYEFGVRAESIFYYRLRNVPKEFWNLEMPGNVPHSWQAPQEEYHAYTASELGEMLPCESGLIYWDVCYNDHIGEWYCRIHDLVKELKKGKEVIAHEAEGDTMAEAMADALIHCLENKLVTPHKH